MGDSLVSEYFSSDNASISANGGLNQAFVGLGVQANFVDSGIGSIVTFDSGFGSVSFVTFHSDNMSNFSSFVDSAISSTNFSEGSLASSYSSSSRSSSSSSGSRSVLGISSVIAEFEFTFSSSSSSS